jgi:hypothetical protein
MMEQVPIDVNLLAQELAQGIKEASPIRVHGESSMETTLLDDALRTQGAQLEMPVVSFVRLRALELAVKMADPDSEVQLGEILANADALVRYINGAPGETIRNLWRDDMVRLHQQRETPIHEPDA